MTVKDDRPWPEIEADLIAERGLGYEDITQLDERHVEGIAIYVARLEAERSRLAGALNRAADALFDAACFIDDWDRRMPVRRAAEAAKNAVNPSEGER